MGNTVTFPNAGSERAEHLLGMMCAGGHPCRPNVEQIRTIRTLCVFLRDGALPESYSYHLEDVISLWWRDGRVLNVTKTGGLFA